VLAPSRVRSTRSALGPHLSGSRLAAPRPSNTTEPAGITTPSKVKSSAGPELDHIRRVLFAPWTSSLACERSGRTRTLISMSVVPNPEDLGGLTVLDPEEALLRARPLPSDAEMAIEGLTDDEWKAFEKALAER
jgi:hypothetical protein